MSKLTRDVWVFDSFRPNFLIWDSLQHKATRELLEAYKNETIDDIKNSEIRKMDKKALAYAALDYTSDKSEWESMKVIQADAEGQFETDDPVMAYKIHKALSEAPMIKHPVTMQPVKFVVDRRSPAIPTKDEVAKILTDRMSTKETSKKAS